MIESNVIDRCLRVMLLIDFKKIVIDRCCGSNVGVMPLIDVEISLKDVVKLMK